MNATTGTVVGTSGASTMLATVLVWLLSLRGIVVPDDVALAFTGLFTMAAHFLVASHIQNTATGAGGTPLTAPQGNQS